MAFVGDSIGMQSVDGVVDAVAPTRPISDLLVANGATIPWSTPQVADVVSGEDAPSILVVELGHADVAWQRSRIRLEREVRAFLDATAPHVDCVRWFDIKPTDTRFVHVNSGGERFNRMLRAVARDYPNVEVFPYSAWALYVPRATFIPDLLHLTDRSELEFGRMVRQAADGCDPGRSSGPLWDVRDDHWAARSVAWANDQSIVTGYTGGTFRGAIGDRQMPATRSQLATALWRRVGSPQVVGNRWPDVTTVERAAVNWATDHHLMSGFPGGRFRPDDAVTRGQLARALWRDADSPAAAPATWADVPGSLARAVAWVEATRALAPLPDGTFGATVHVSRYWMVHSLAPAEVRGPLRPAAPAPPPSTAPAPTQLVVPGDPILVAPD